MNVTALTVLLVVLIVADALLRAVARRLQLRHQPDAPPPEVADRLDAERYAQGRAYARENARTADLEDTVSVVVWTGLLATGALGAWHDAIAARVQADWFSTLLFLASVAAAFLLLGAAFAARRTFGTEARFGFNTTTLRQFVRDRIVGAAVTAVLGGALLLLLLWSLAQWGSGFWIPYAVVVAAFLIFMNTFYTTLLLPLFNRLEPLADGELKDSIRRYVEGVGFALRDTYVMDGSKRSTKANAFFSGLGRTRKVVLFDTLMQRHPVPEVVAVVAHEVGHARLRHGPALLAVSVASVTIMLALLGLVIESPALSLALGGSEHSVGLALIAFTVLISPLSLALGVAANALSRRFEFQADAFAARGVGKEPMQEALKRLTSDVLAEPLHHPLYAALHASHPSTVERLRALERPS